MGIQDLSGYVGLCATGSATVNLWLGTLMSMRYSPVQHWPHRRINVFALHQWTAYTTVALVLAHPALLLFLPGYNHFGLFDVLWPVHSPVQPVINFLGAMAAYLLVLLLVTSLLRNRVGRPIWRKLHYLSFPAMVLVFVHGILTDNTLMTGHARMLDARKFCVDFALLLCLVAVGLRIRLRGKRLRIVPAAEVAAD